MLRNRRGATSLRWLRALLDHGIEVHGQVVVCPGVNDGAVLDDTLAGVLDQLPRAGHRSASCRSASAAFNTEPRMRPHTAGRGRAPWSTASHDWQDVFLRGARPPPRVRRRRVLPARRAARSPTPEAYEGFPMHEDGIGMARTFELEFTGPGRPTPPAPQAGLLRLGRRRAAPTGYRAPRRDRTSPTGGVARRRRPLVQVAPVARDAPVGILTGAYGARVLAPLVAGLGRDDVRVVAGRQPFFGGNTGVTGLLVGEDLARVLAGRARGPPLPAARRLPVRRAASSTAPRPTTCPARSRSSPPTAHALRRALDAVTGRADHDRSPSSPSSAAPTSASPRCSTASSAAARPSSRRSPASPATARRSRPSGTGRRFRLVDTGGWMPGGDALDDKVSRQSEQAIARGRRRPLRGRRRRRASPRRTPGSPSCSAGADAAGVRSSPTRSTTPAARRRSGSSLSPRPRRARGRSAPSTAAAPATCSTRSSALLPEPDDERGRRGRPRPTPTASAVFAVALVGRPNVGKSTLFNRLIGEERAVVHDMPGTTRDTIDTVVETADGPIRFVDTAGMRRKAKIDEGTEYYSLVRALQAVDDADVALLVIDATEGVTHQDQRLAERIDAAGCPIVVLLNKWELLDAEARADVDLPGRPSGCTSSARRRCSRSARSPARACTSCCPALADDDRGLPPPGARPGRSTRSSAPPSRPSPRPTAAGSSTPPRAPPTRPRSRCSPTRSSRATYLRYLERRLREAFDLGATPIKLRVAASASRLDLTVRQVWC